MKNKILIIATVLALMLCLCSCQLALEDGAQVREGDRLIGAFITREYLDLLDFEAYISDNIGDITDGGEVSGDMTKYQGRIYATQTEVDGVRQYLFPDVEGMALYAPNMMGEREAVHVSLQSDLFNANFSYGDRIDIVGTLFAAAGEYESEPGVVFYINPVYQSADGSVYLISGTGTSTNCLSVGSTMSMSISEEYSETRNGETKKTGVSVKCNIEGKNQPTKVVLYQMDSGNKDLSGEEYAPEDVPESLTVLKDAAYILMETHTLDISGEAGIEREVISLDKETFNTFYVDDKGLFNAKLISLK